MPNQDLNPIPESPLLSCGSGELLQCENASLKRQVSELEEKLKDTTELLHLWMNEAASYRWLVEAVAAEKYPLSRAKELICEHALQLPRQKVF